MIIPFPVVGEQRMSEQRRSTSRRTFLKYGAVSTGTLLGTARAGADTGSESAGSGGEAIDHGILRSYQFTPEARFTVVESGLDWRPEQFEHDYRTSVIAYDHAPSFRAFLFTEPDVGLESDRSFTFTGVQEPPQTVGHRFVTVGLEPADSTGTGTAADR